MHEWDMGKARMHEKLNVKWRTDQAQDYNKGASEKEAELKDSYIVPLTGPA